MTTITMPRRLMRPMASPPARRAVLIGFFSTLGAAFLVLAAISLSVGFATGGTILSGVSVGGVQLAGLDRVAAEEHLRRQLPSMAEGQVTVVVGDSQRVAAYADLGRQYEIDAMVDAAFRVGRDGNALTDGIARLRSLTADTSLPILVRGHEAGALERIASVMSYSFGYSAVDATVRRDGLAFEVTPSRDGRRVDAAAIQAALVPALASVDPADLRVEVEPRVLSPRVTSAEATRAAAVAEDMVAALSLTVPDAEPFVVEAQDIASWIGFGTDSDGAFGVLLDEAAVVAAVEALVETVDREPVNARFELSGTGLGGVIAAEDGRTLNVEETADEVLAALGQRGTGAPVASLAMTVDLTEPALSTEEAEAALPEMQLVSSWTTYYVPSDQNGFGNNISIPARDIDGRTLAPGEWFSFWGSVGPITPERGFTYGGVIINGRSIPNGAIGGGICSTSTTIFNAAMRFGLEMGDRLNHYYYIDRYPVGLDATVYMDDNFVQDMTFRNDTEHPIVIRGYGSPGQVTFQLWSVPNGRTVALSAPYTSNHRTAVDTTRVDPSMAPGTARREEFAHNGFNASVSRTVRDADGTVLHEDTWFSNYRPVNGLTLVGPAASAPDPAEEGDTAGEEGSPEP